MDNPGAGAPPGAPPSWAARLLRGERASEEVLESGRPSRVEMARHFRQSRCATGKRIVWTASTNGPVLCGTATTARVSWGGRCATVVLTVPWAKTRTTPTASPSIRGITVGIPRSRDAQCATEWSTAKTDRTKRSAPPLCATTAMTWSTATPSATEWPTAQTNRMSGTAWFLRGAVLSVHVR